MSGAVEIPTGYTIGPWRVVDRDADGECFTGISAYQAVWGGLASVVVRFEGDDEDCAEGRANARLIALAPQMAAELLADVTRLTASLAAAEAEAGRLRGDVVRAAEDMRLAAMEAALARLTPLNAPADWTEYARTRAEAAGQVAAAILKVPLPQVPS